MNIKNYVIIFTFSILMPTMAFTMDRKDGDRTQEQPSVPASASQPVQPPFQAVNPSQPAAPRDALDDAIEASHNAVNNMPRAQALQPVNNGWSLKKLAATTASCALGAFCGYLIKRMWCDLHTDGLLELPATMFLAFANHDFADNIGGSSPLADIAMISSAILSSKSCLIPAKDHKYAGGIFIRGGGVIVA